jgi:YidC/Oxa1 family membrane protein insertase
MKNRQMVIGSLLSVALLAGWYLARWYVFVHLHPEWATQPTTQPAEQPKSAATTTTAVTTSPAATQRAIVATTGPIGRPIARGEATSSDLGYLGFDPKGEKKQPIGLTIDPRGASVAEVRLNHFREHVGENTPYIFQREYKNKDIPTAFRSALATQTVIVNDTPVDLADFDWARTAVTKTSATYSVELPVTSGGKLIVNKTFELRPDTHPGQGYEIEVKYSFVNQTKLPIRVKTFFNGPNVPPVENNRDLPEVVVGYNDKGDVVLNHTDGKKFAPDKDPTSLKSDKNMPLLWAGITSAYFDAIIRPQPKVGETPTIADVTAHGLAAPSEDGNEFVALVFETSELTVPAGQTTGLTLEVFFGPRQRAVLNTPYYQAFPLAYNNTLVLTGGLCSFCTFQKLIDILVWMLGTFHMIFRDWGLAIICLVIIVRVLLHPVTKKSQVSMAKMGKMGPEIERLKKKFGDNKEEMNKAMMAVYKEQGFTPVLGCLPMLLQMPIWIALWSSLQSTFELRHASFLWGYTWIHDLAQPDHFFYFPANAINFFFLHIDAINILPILMAGVFWVQQKMTPKPAAATPEQETQYKMMQYMSLLFPIFLYTGPSGLNLYILTSTGIGIVESKRIRDHIKEKEEAEKAGRVIVDAKPTRASRRLARDGQPEEKQAPGFIATWLAKLQNKAEQMRKDSDRKGKKD